VLGFRENTGLISKNICSYRQFFLFSNKNFFPKSSFEDGMNLKLLSLNLLVELAFLLKTGLFKDIIQ